MIENLIQSDIAIIAIFTFIGFMFGVWACLVVDIIETRKRNKHLASSLPPTRDDDSNWRVN